MEKGSFHDLNFNNLEFIEDENQIIDQTFTEKNNFSFGNSKSTSSAHQVVEFRNLPKDSRRSSSVEALLSQNEDLMARLTVTIRRLTILEEEHQAQSDELHILKDTHSAVLDQMLIWKEKERIWKERNEQLGSELQTIQSRFPDLLKMESQIERLKRYQDKVKSTIKPYVAQLKAYAHSLHEQIQSLNSELNQKESNIRKLEQQLEASKEKSNQYIEFYEKNQNELVSRHEKESSHLRHEIEILTESNLNLELKAQHLDRTLERQDELENTIISLRRSKQEFQEQIQSELNELRTQNRELKQSQIDLQMQNQDLLESKTRDAQELKTSHSRREDLEEQLTSLRYMWAAKSDENEKLQISMKALERLNLELSSKLKDLRK